MQNVKANKSTVLAGILLFAFFAANAQKHVSAGDKILGQWISEKRNLIVEINKYGNEYLGKVIWFSDKDNPQYPMNDRIDFNNPDVSLRKRKLIGLVVLKALTYEENSHSWENGLIYDSRSGKEWNSCVNLTADGSLYVKGYWHFKFIGKTTTFRRINF
jgi:uncharacterized protein (DUF2147 family)